MSGAAERARAVADAVLFEGYALYLYRASALKNRYRWPFGVLAPSVATGPASDPDLQRTEIPVDGPEDAAVRVTVRWLHLESRRVFLRTGEDLEPVDELTVDGRRHVTWDEGHVVEVEVPAAPLRALREGPVRRRVELDPLDEHATITDEHGHDAGQVVRRRRPVTVTMEVSARRVGAVHVLRVDVHNVTGADLGPDAAREQVLAFSAIGVHAIIELDEAAAVSVIDPPDALRDVAADCRSLHTWPVLVGAPPRSSTVLSSPVVLGDDPAIAPQSQGDLFDATEIEELLALRIATLTDAERAEAVATDPRAAQVVHRFDPQRLEAVEELHATMAQAARDAPGAWEHLLGDGRPPGGCEVDVDGVVLRAGSRVRLAPAPGGDAQDQFLDGRSATIVGVFRDVDDRAHVAVSIDDDPGADLARGRHRYFGAHEIVPLAVDV